MLDGWTELNWGVKLVYHANKHHKLKQTLLSNLLTVTFCSKAKQKYSASSLFDEISQPFGVWRFAPKCSNDLMIDSVVIDTRCLENQQICWSAMVDFESKTKTFRSFSKITLLGGLFTEELTYIFFYWIIEFKSDCRSIIDALLKAWHLVGHCQGDEMIFRLRDSSALRSISHRSSTWIC